MWWLFLALAAVQGLAEFLPISSSGHLRLLQELFGVEEPLTIVDVLLHFGTLFAVVIVYRALVGRLLVATGRALRTALTEPSRLRAAWRSDADLRLAAFVVLGTVPTAVIALTLGPYLERASGSLAFVGVALLVNAALLTFLGRQIRRQRDLAARSLADPADVPPPRDLSQLGWRDALLIGLAQGAAITRGISRSGSTITAAVSLGIRQDAAAAFSFLLSIPAIVGAVVLSLRDLGPGEAAMLPEALAAAAVAAVVGFFALTWLLTLLDRGRLGLFAGYCALIGLLALVLSLASA